MKNIQLANRYAKAIYAVAKEEGKQEQVFAELSALAGVLEDAELKKHLNSPIVSRDDKKSIANRLLESASFSDMTKNFINLLCDKDRLAVFSEISSLFQKLLDEDNGVVRGIVTCASDLESDEKTSLETKVAKLLNKKLVLEYKKDPNLLGGVVVNVGDYTLDYSVNRQLERIKESLNAGVQ